MAALETYEKLVELFQNVKTIDDATKLATSPQTQDTQVAEMTVVCTEIGLAATGVAFDFVGGKDVAFSMTLASANAVLKACTLAAPTLVAGLQTAIDTAKAAWNSAAANFASQSSGNAADVMALSNAVDTGNLALATQISNRIFEATNFLGTTQNSDGGVTFTENGLTETWSDTWQPEEAKLINPDNSTLDTTVGSTGLVTTNTTNSAGKITQTTVDNIDGTINASFFNGAQTDALVAQQFLGADDSGTLTLNNHTITYAAGKAPDLENLQVHTDGTFTSTLINDDSTGQFNYNAAGQLTSSSKTFDVGGHTQTTFSTDPNSAQLSQTLAFDDNNNLISSAIVNRDGTMILQNIDPTTGQPILTTNVDNQNNSKLTAGQVSNESYTQFQQAVADTFATQIISKVLITNDLPASIAAQAFADATINSALALSGTASNTSFSQDFANSVFDVAGGIAGSDVGSIVAKALGVPQEIGSLAGGVAGNLLAESLVNSAAEALNLVDTAEGVFNAANFATGLESAGEALAGSELANLIVPTNLAGEIAGSVASTAALAATSLGLLDGLAPVLFATNPIGAVLLVLSTAFGSDFIGTLIGDAFGGLFGGPSVGPDATAQNVFNSTTQTFALTTSSADNGGNPAIAQQLVQAEAAEENSILKAIGGTLGVAPTDSLGYFEGSFFWAPGIQAPLSFPNTFADGQSAVNFGALWQLRSDQFFGGDVAMEFMLMKTNATTPDQLSFDLAAARDYSVYLSDPTTFDLSLAMSGDASQFATWQSELARIHALGLDNVKAIGTATNIYGGNNGVDYFSYQNGQLFLQQFDSFGNLFAAGLMLNPNGTPITVDINATVVGGWGINLLGNTGNTFFIKNPDGHVITYTIFNQALRNINTGANVEVIGIATSSYQAVAGIISYDIVYRDANGHLAITKYGNQGPVVAGGTMTNANGTAFSIAAGCVLDGYGTAFLNAVGHAFFIRQTDGTVDILEINDVTNQVSAGGNATVLGQGLSLFGLGGKDVFYSLNGQLLIAEFDSNSLVLKGGPMTSPGGAAILLDSTATIAQLGQNLFGTGGNDIILRQSNGLGVVLEFVNGVLVDTGNVTTNVDGSYNAVLIDSSGGDFSVIGNVYTAANQLTSQEEWFWDGTHTHTDFGAAGGSVVKTVNSFDANGVLQTSNQINTDGSTVFTQFNPSGVDGWAKSVDSINAAGQTTENDVYYTDGGHDNYIFPLNVPTIANFDNYYVADGTLDHSVQNNVDASSIYTQYNTSGTGGWLTQVFTKNTAGQTTEEVISYNDDTHDDITFPHNGGTIANVDNYFLADGTLADSTQTNTDGSVIDTQFDVDGEDFIKGVYTYNPSGALLERDVLFDGDGHWITVGTLSTTLNGGAGYSSYEFNSSTFGQDVIHNNSTVGAQGEIDFDSTSITDEKLWLKKSGNDLIIQLLHTNDTIDIAGWFSSPNNQIQSIHANGLTLDTQIATLVNAMATYQAAHTTFNPATATAMPTDTTLQHAITTAWHA